MTLRFCGLLLMIVGTQACSTAWGTELLVGGATVNITPDKPVALDGHRGPRITSQVVSPVTATALALESREGDKSLDAAIFVSVDLVVIDEKLSKMVRERLKDRVPGFDPSKLILSATHTHNAPVTVVNNYQLPTEGIIQPAEYVEFLVDKLANICEQAWKTRQPGAMAWGLGHAKIAYNRRAIYDDGTAEMYGKTGKPNFRGIEGNEDNGVEVLFFWDAKQKLIATVINIACPSQDAERSPGINADFWHDTREALQAKYGKDLFMLGWCGAGGDQSPHVMYRIAAEERMQKLRGMTRLADLGQRVVRAWEDAYDGAKHDIRTDVPMMHKVETITLSPRIISQEEALASKQKAAEFANNPKELWNYNWQQRVVNLYDEQQSGKLVPYTMEMHVLRLGDVAITTNPFELFTEYGIQMKARSPSIQTFVIQLACQSGGYVPTAHAVRGGGYSAVPQSNVVGPEGGRELVEKTLSTIKTFWPQK